MWTLYLALGCAPEDVDLDGVPADVDCDDTDPFVYPGAEDTPGDGVDADCADGDPPYPWLGAWTMTSVVASYSGIQLFEDGSTGGSLDVAEDLSVTATITGDLDDAMYGFSLPVEFTMTGAASPIPGPDAFWFYAEGIYELSAYDYTELMHVSWDCVTLEDEMSCGGELKALGASLDADATLGR